MEISEKIKLVIVGSGGFAREVAFLLENSKQKQEYELIGYVENDIPIDTRIGNSQIVGDDEWLLNYQNKLGVIIAIGEPRLRKKLVDKFIFNKNLIFPNIIASTSIISNDVKMGMGNIFCDGTIVTVDIKIGNFNIFNLGVTIGHETRIGDYVTINPGTNVSGNVVIGNMITIGTGVKMIPKVNIGNYVTIGAGTVVIKSIEEKCTVVGNPARRIK